ncbi:hypothetical protein PDIDSM_4024 [Penicillium digitatum]|nr:hypothetical protein PDIDSM_4024 [Penicillium digitatum]
MCGIFACHHHPDVQKFKPTALRMAKAVRHRGPDWSGNFCAQSTILAHERLSIVGIDSGAQPLVNDDSTLALAVNGEIYNHRLIRKNLHHKYNFKTHSDCEVIIPLYEEYGLDAPKHLDGMFSWVLWDKKQDRVVAARDPIGVTSFYLGRSSSTPGAVYFASELKCLHPVCDDIIAFPPGHIYDSNTDTLTRYFEPKWWNPANVPSTPVDYKVIRHSLEKAVRKRLMAEVPYGVLLSGGLDSSLVASIAQRETLRMAEAARNAPRNLNADGELVGIDDDNELSTVTTFQQLHSFSIGLPGAPDTAAAIEVAKFLGTKHHPFTFTVEEGLDALSDVIYHLETYDVTTIRASTPMYLLSRKIKAMGVKMVLSGEGSDEIFGGYLYFHAAPNKEELHKETVRRVKNLHSCAQTSAGVVADKSPLLSIPKTYEKEQFSDGVGYSWIDGLKDEAERQVTDEMMKNPKPEWGSDVPDTKEAYWYRTMFDEHFPPYCAGTVERWTPTWSKQTDPSGRAIAIHNQKYDKSE